MSEDVNVDDLLDSTLDDLEDLPSFAPFPAGVHHVKVTLEQKEVAGHPSVEVSCEMVETKELANPTDDTAPKPGDKAGTLCMLDNEFGRGNLKLLATPIGQSLGVSSIREVIEQATDIECLIVSTVKKDKNDPDTLRMNIKELEVI